MFVGIYGPPSCKPKSIMLPRLLNKVFFPYFSFDICIASWSQTNSTTTTPSFIAVYSKNKISPFDSFAAFAHACVMCKIINNLALNQLKEFILQNTEQQGPLQEMTKFQLRSTTFGHAALSVRAISSWNSMPIGIKQSLNLTSFKTQMKTWLKAMRICKRWILTNVSVLHHRWCF